MFGMTSSPQHRARVRGAVRAFFEARGYTEVETPALTRHPDQQPTLSYLETEVRVRGEAPERRALITSPEYAHKKLVAQGMPRTFEFARVFRNNEPNDAWHGIEFTMLEWYRLGASFEDGMEETMALIADVAKNVTGRAQAHVNGARIPLDRAFWEVRTVASLMEEHAGLTLSAHPTRETYAEWLDVAGLFYEPTDTISDLFQRVMLNLVDPALMRAPHPTVVAYYPWHEASLSRINKEGWAERFEVFIGGVELCNAYGELTDAKEQRRRFEFEQTQRRENGQPVYPIDEELIIALENITEPLFGNALGFDRLVALLS